MANFVRRLKKHSRGLILTQSFGALVSGFLAWSGLLVLLDLYDAYSPIQETEVSSWMFGVAFVSALSFVGILVRTWFNRPSPKELAKRVEAANPQLRDLLNTAIEIENKGKEPKFMESRVLRHLDKKSQLMDWGKTLRPSSSFLNYLIIGFLSGVGLTVWNFDRSPMSKVRGLLSGESGLTVWTSPSGSSEYLLNHPDAEYSRGTDVSIHADILRAHRGTKEARIEWLEKIRPSG